MAWSFAACNARPFSVGQLGRQYMHEQFTCTALTVYKKELQKWVFSSFSIRCQACQSGRRLISPTPITCGEFHYIIQIVNVDSKSWFCFLLGTLYCDNGDNMSSWVTTVRTPELTNLSSTEQKFNALFLPLTFLFYSWYSVTHHFFFWCILWVWRIEI